MSLSERIRPNCEAAPWVVEEVKQLEAKLLSTQRALVDYDDAACAKNQTMLIIIGLISRVHSDHSETITAARVAVEQAGKESAK